MVLPQKRVRTRESKVTDFFQPRGKQPRKAQKENAIAEQYAARLGCRPTYLTPDKASWILHVPQWMPPPTTAVWQEEWNLHPTARHELFLFGKTVQENRWSQMWGRSYQYSGATNTAQPLTEAGATTRELMERVNEISKRIVGDSASSYNAILQNWYESTHTIGLHSDDERRHVAEMPIWSLSWGGTRRFVLKPRHGESPATEIYLHSGDLLIMGGTCQKTHKHMVPAVRKTKDNPTGNRTNWTIRAFQQ